MPPHLPQNQFSHSNLITIMHTEKKTAQNASKRELDFEEKVYVALRWLYGESVKEDKFSHEHLFGMLLLGEKIGITSELTSAMLEHLKKTGRYELFADTMPQVLQEIAACEGLVEEDVRM